ncbi:hypothetical protein ABZ733_00615 [Streptomyces longwoodensis]|uniref:hypothetical protein n=1 Tax=Streptomyces longwoodensis TaxID=68231 RepID=UPI0033F7AF2E
MSAEAIVRQSVVDVLEERLRTSILDGALHPARCSRPSVSSPLPTASPGPP